MKTRLLIYILRKKRSTSGNKQGAPVICCSYLDIDLCAGEEIDKVVNLLVAVEVLLLALGGSELVALHVPELGAALVVRPQCEVIRSIRLGLRVTEGTRDVQYLCRRAQLLRRLLLEAVPYPVNPALLIVELHLLPPRLHKPSALRRPP